MTETDKPDATERARAKASSDLIWHIGACVIINAFDAVGCENGSGIA